MFLFKGDYWAHPKTINGVRYEVYSFYAGDKNVFDKIGDLIVDSFQSANIDELTNEFSVDSDMAIEEE
ncbi:MULTISPECIES: hypothetical protein [Eubacteriales]|uniref:hypothetical protein n=1 Tax=Eubacteriales TaxID=186802 RepID=UPI0008218EAB|nr:MULTISPECIES: hypothetical protein [Eubacteriales]MCI6015174.1 DUF1699 family protein [Dysosmobacter sp.]MCI6362494.1 DUF1699 family protein [Intestinimonas butyriciproducens]MDY3617101.1 hypothetical protein [Intestinimonas butyriciproducens]SCI78138.1 Uncharacterised protein [uncultured Clostridium sp.]